MNARNYMPSPLLHNRTVLNRKGGKGDLNNVLVRESLEDIRDLLRKMAKHQEAVDHERTFSQLMVSFEEDFVRARLIDNSDESWIVSKTAFQQMDASLLPRSGGNFLQTLSGLQNEDAKRAATGVWYMFAQQDNEKPRKFRTARTRMPDGSIGRVLRAQVSQSYASYSNLEFVEAVLAHTELGDLRVIDYRVDDDAMRIRLAAVPEGGLSVDKPFPMFCLSNSETGRRTTRFTGGLFRAICLNGMGSWDKQTQWAWRHYGDAGRIQQGVASAATEISTALNGTLEAYERAAQVFISDTFGFVDQMLGNVTGVSQKVIEQVKLEGIVDETSHSKYSLAGVVDGITFIAQKPEYDLFAQDWLEELAADVLRRGLGMADEHERILVEA